ncbi:hypothetical protein BTO04_05930 [Polaribacter sp. SA4-10]|uniref:DUF2851 family protein n=1 Tax=Polaribacter sp. SA4-10 TaxID=754397 RepID=UPI000B3C9D7F|nr:DUF2851 family protein [Polaribacter sp. SA4-10]ARV06265.1 hypothetical protein BTO04_05930 [Polaribacter sp. SA4-10]
MKEEFLHYVWKYKLFSQKSLEIHSKEKIIVVKSGIYNTNSGPDFLNSQLKIESQLWAGNVEIHVKSSDWYLHQHEKDANYDAVILHVVWEHDTAVFMKNNKPIPTLVLKDLVDDNLLKNYQKLVLKQPDWIPCETQINTVESFTFNNWLERLYFERLANKSNSINQLLVASNNDFEAVLFQLIAKNFGLKVNAEAFLRLAKSIDFSIIRKERFNELVFSALLFGQAGFLEGNIQDEYHSQLKKEYEYLQHKYNLHPIANRQFMFFRMRPSNFPTIRIAQLVSLFHQQENLFSKVIKIENLEGFYTLFSVGVNEFWKTHYTFESISKKSAKNLTKSFIDLLIINTIIPLKFLYQKSRGEVDEERIIKLIKQIKPEKNSIISKFSDLKINSTSAFETQSLLELRNNYCASKRCLKCAIGVKILNRN